MNKSKILLYFSFGVVAAALINSAIYYLIPESEALYSIPPTAAWSNFTIGGTSIEADRHNDEFEFIAGSGITLTPDSINDSVIITNTGSLSTGGGGIGNFTADYLIVNNGSHTFAINGTTAAIDFFGDNATTVINLSFDGLKQNRDFKQKVVLKGNYTIDETIEIPSYTSLMIYGKLTAVNGLDESLIENEPNSEYIDICCGVIDGNRYNQNSPTIDDSTIDISRLENFHIYDLTVIDGWTAGIRTEHSQYGVIENNRLIGSNDDCLAINEKTNYTAATNNIISGCGYGPKFGNPNGIEIQDGAHDISLVGNIIRSAKAGGIEASTHPGFPSPFNIVFSGNTITNTTNGIQLLGSSNSFISDVNIFGNNIFNISNTGVAFSYAKSNVMSDNYFNITDNAINIFTESRNNIIKDNFISQSEHAGIQIESIADNNIIMNNIIVDSGAAGSGIRVGINILGDDNQIINNVIQETGNGDTRNGIRLGAGTSGNDLRGNHFIDIVTRNILDSGATDFTTTHLTDYWDIGETRRVVKTVDESLSSSTTLQNDDELSISIGGDGAIAGQYLVVNDFLYNATTTPDIKTTINTPAGTTGYYCEDASGNGGVCVALGSTTHHNAFGIPYNMRTTAFIETDGTSGSITLQWAQQTNNANPTQVLKGSSMSITRLS